MSGRDGAGREDNTAVSALPTALSAALAAAEAETERLYGDILGCAPPEPDPLRHPRMSAAQRAAQFSPFAALKGYDTLISETARVTQARPQLDEDRKAELDRILSELALRTDRAGERASSSPPGASPAVRISYFAQDARGEGGEIRTAAGSVRRVDGQKRVIELKTGESVLQIRLDDVLGIAETQEQGTEEEL